MAEAGDFHKIGNIRGRDGTGVPEGGVQGEMLVKVGSSDFATAWAFPEYKDIVGKVPKSALPDIGNSTVPVGSEAAMLNLPAVVGNMAIRTDIGKTFVLAEEPASELDNWVELVTASDVVSVNGYTGNVNLAKADIGLDQVNNTADSDKPEVTTSVRGLMSANDKVKLNNATAAATASRLAIRDSAGRIAFKQVTLSDPPTSDGHSATKAYVDSGLDGRVKVLGVLGQGFDLNNLKENAVGVQATSVYATSSLNYPEQTAGAIQAIYSGGSMVYQFYTTYSTSGTKIYWRTFYSSSWGAWKQVVDTSMLADEVAAGVKPVNFQLNELQGGHVLTKSIPSGVGWTAGTLGDDWDGLRSYAQTGVVEGWVKGCPVGGSINTTYNLSAGFVKDPVWKLEVRPEGLNYVTQRATLLNCVPVFMTGFVWERVYNPVTAKWSAWKCVSGDTGPINSVDKSVASLTPEQPLVHRNSSSLAILYNPSIPIVINRTGPEVFIYGAMRGFGSALTEASGRPFAWIGTDTLSAGVPGWGYTVSYVEVPGYQTYAPQQGSGTSKWHLSAQANDLVAARYDGDVPSGGVWLPFALRYLARPINTYTGPGFVPPVLEPQTGTPSS